MDTAYKFLDHSSDNLLIWFGGRNEPFISQKMCVATGCDLLTIKNMRGDWYTGGIMGADGDPSVWLGEQIKKKSYTRVFIAGQSSGGYMALKMSHDHNPTAAIVFNPTTQNWPVGSRIFNPSFRITNLNDLYVTNPVEFPIVLNVGRSEKDHAAKWKCDDLEHAKIIAKMDNVTYVQHPYDTHVLTMELAKHGKFYKYVASVIALYS